MSGPAFQKSAILYDLGKYEHAEAEVRRGLAQDPDDARTHALLALCIARRSRRPGMADQEMAAAISRAPDDPHVHYLRAQMLGMTGRPVQAEAAAREALRLDPQETEYLGYLGALLIDLKRPAEALETLETGLKLAPRSVRCLFLRAWALLRLGRPGEAESAAREALQVDPENAIAHRLLGEALLDLGKAGDALTPYLESCRIDPTDLDARSGAIRCMKARIPVLGAGLQLFWRFLALPKWAVVTSTLAFFGGFTALAVWSESSLLTAIAVSGLLYGYAALWLLTKCMGRVFDFALQFDPIGRRFISRLRRMEANLFVSMAVLCLGVVVSAALEWWEGAAVSFALGIMLPPCFAVFRCRAGARRRWMIAFAAVMPVSILGMLLSVAFRQEDVGRAFVLLFLFGLLAALPASLWIPPKSGKS